MFCLFGECFKDVKILKKNSESKLDVNIFVFILVKLV